MGRQLVDVCRADGRYVVVTGVERAGVVPQPALDGVLVTADLSVAFGGVDGVIDFAAPAACTIVAARCAALGLPYLVGSTALGAADQEALARAAAAIPVLAAANLSIGVNVLLELVGAAARRLGAGFDVELVELHHKHKKDAPSGTALALAAAVREARPELVEEHSRHGITGPRSASALGVAAVRGGDVAGEHTVLFLGHGERLELTHRASSSVIFAQGALTAMDWLRQAPPGLYGMRDVVGRAKPPA
ncbi:MAG: 4-hydroxy-tetrahydrodipicolinate reductase [Deltaproteobacteria bacterium]|nr:4-hydroxy-tetrahydrodipicolinate reductase [Deltaproteobacteria bacterium]